MTKPFLLLNTIFLLLDTTEDTTLLHEKGHKNATVYSNYQLYFYQTVSIPCTYINKKKKSSIDWIRDDNSMLSDRINVNHTDNGTEIVFDYIHDKSELGLYKCIQRDAPNKIYQLAEIHVVGIGLIEINSNILIERNVTVRLGDELILNCSVTGFPVLNVEWSTSPGQKNAYLLSHTKTDLHLTSMAVFNISSIQKTDIGLYKCVANNSYFQKEGWIKVILNTRKLYLFIDLFFYLFIYYLIKLIYLTLRLELLAFSSIARTNISQSKSVLKYTFKSIVIYFTFTLSQSQAEQFTLIGSSTLLSNLYLMWCQFSQHNG